MIYIYIYILCIICAGGSLGVLVAYVLNIHAAWGKQCTLVNRKRSESQTKFLKFQVL